MNKHSFSVRRSEIFGRRDLPSLWVSLIPLSVLLFSLLGVIIAKGADSVSSFGPWILLISAAIAMGLAWVGGIASRRGLKVGFVRSALQILPAIPILICIAMVATTWMLSGVVPTLIAYGLEILSPKLFLVIACSVCAVISVMTGSSWTTIATIGVAFMGIGEVMGFSDPWIAGALATEAYHCGCIIYRRSRPFRAYTLSDLYDSSGDGHRSDSIFLRRLLVAGRRYGGFRSDSECLAVDIFNIAMDSCHSPRDSRDDCHEDSDPHCPRGGGIARRRRDIRFPASFRYRGCRCGSVALEWFGFANRKC